MRITWLWPATAEIRSLLTGAFYVNIDAGAMGFYATIKDAGRGYHVCRVDFPDPAEVPDRKAFMETMLLVAEVQYNELKEKNGATV